MSLISYTPKLRPVSHWSRQQRNGPGRLLLHGAATRSRFEEPSAHQLRSREFSSGPITMSCSSFTSPGQLLCLSAKYWHIEINWTAKYFNWNQLKSDNKLRKIKVLPQVGKRMRFRRFYGFFCTYFPTKTSDWISQSGCLEWNPCANLPMLECFEKILSEPKIPSQIQSSSHDSSSQNRVKPLKTQFFFHGFITVMLGHCGSDAREARFFAICQRKSGTPHR